MAVAATAGSVGEALAAARDALAAAGVESPRLDAELMLCEATGWDSARLAADPDAGVPAPAARRFGAMVRRRVRREPLAYVTGRRWFRRLELAADGRALVPRPETELLVEVAVELGPATVLDVGTGSGAVALAIADELPAARVVATDSSAAALELARENAARLGLAGRVRFAAGSVPPGERFEAVVANLPYVRDDEWPRLAPEIREFEPRAALAGGPDGLDVIRAVVPAAVAALEPGGTLALEVGVGQAAAVAGLVRDAGCERVVSRRDLAAIERVVLGRRDG